MTMKQASQRVQTLTPVIAIIISIVALVYPQYKQCKSDKASISSIKDIITGFIQTDYAIETGKMKDNELIPDKLFLNTKEFNDWLGSRIISIPSKKERDVLMIGKKYILQKDLLNNNPSELSKSLPDLKEISDSCIMEMEKL